MSTYHSLQIEYWGEQLSNAAHKQKGCIMKNACATLGLANSSAFYRRLEKIGWKSGKAKRCDAGTTAMSDEAINMLVSVLNLSVRENGKRIMNTPAAKSILQEHGYDLLSPSQISRVLAARNASIKQLDKATPHISLKSAGPNHVHQADPSYCLLYYPPNKNGKCEGKRQKYMNDADYYANKPDNIDEIKNLRVWRYVLTDHFSGAIRLFYFEAAGENQANMFTFLMWCWQSHEGSPFMGVPEILMWDKGSANGAKAIKNVLKSLKVKDLPHAAGNPRATGSVERAQNIVETQFESRILFEPVDSVAELNESAWAWQEAYNANLIKGQNCLHSRHKQPRYDIWLMIYMPEYRHLLRMLPDEDICRLLLTRDDETRKVKGDLTISYRHPLVKKQMVYDVSELANISSGLTVEVSPVLIAEKADLLVGVKNELGDVVYHQVEPLEFDVAGFRVDAALIGDEYKRNKDSSAQTNAKAADKLAFPEMNESQIKKAKKTKAAPFGGELKAHSFLKDIEHQTRIMPKGQQIEANSPITKQVEQAERTAEVLENTKNEHLDNLDLKILLTEQLGRALRPIELDWLATIGGVTRNEVGDIVEKLHKGVAKAPVLKIAEV